MIEPTGEGKSAVATPDGKKPKEEEEEEEEDKAHAQVEQTNGER